MICNHLWLMISLKQFLINILTKWINYTKISSVKLKAWHYYLSGDIMEKLVEIGILFDFYGKLLSEKQFQAIELYYIHDLSLAEIGEELNITRQGVFDTLKRSEQKLYHYEEILGLVDKFNKSHETIRDILKVAKELQDYGIKNNIDIIYKKAHEIEEIGLEILD